MREFRKREPLPRHFSVFTFETGAALSPFSVFIVVPSHVLSLQLQNNPKPQPPICIFKSIFTTSPHPVAEGCDFPQTQKCQHLEYQVPRSSFIHLFILLLFLTDQYPSCGCQCEKPLSIISLEGTFNSPKQEIYFLKSLS